MDARKLLEKLNTSFDRLEQVDFTKFNSEEQQIIKVALNKLINKVEVNLKESKQDRKAKSS